MPDATTPETPVLTNVQAVDIAHGLMFDAARSVNTYAIQARIDDEYGLGAVPGDTADEWVERIADIIATADMAVGYEARRPARDAHVTGPAAVLSDDDRDVWHAFALNSQQFTAPIRALLMPDASPLWDDYSQAVMDLWDLRYGANPYDFSDADPANVTAEQAREHAIAERIERRDTGLDAVLAAIRAPDRDAP